MLLSISSLRPSSLFLVYQFYFCFYDIWFLWSLKSSFVGPIMHQRQDALLISVAVMCKAKIKKKGYCISIDAYRNKLSDKSVTSGETSVYVDFYPV